MKTFYFVAGEQVITVRSITVLDAWMKVENKSRREPIASEFRNLPIDAFDEEGVKLFTRTWDGWNNEVLRDTYGEGYRAILDNAAALI
jgi:hypothetical protein